MIDNALILAIMVGLATAIVLRFRNRKALREKLIRDFLADPERRERQGI